MKRVALSFGKQLYLHPVPTPTVGKDERQNKSDNLKEKAGHTKTSGSQKRKETGAEVQIEWRVSMEVQLNEQSSQTRSWTYCTATEYNSGSRYSTVDPRRRKNINIRVSVPLLRIKKKSSFDKEKRSPFLDKGKTRRTKDMHCRTFCGMKCISQPFLLDFPSADCVQLKCTFVQCLLMA